MSTPDLQTPRLHLRPYTGADRSWFVATFGDPVVMKHVGGAMTEADAGALFDAILTGTRHRVFAAWCAEDEGVVIGHGALLRAGEDLELGYVLPQHTWGRGYATEIARALTDHALETLGCDRVTATVDEDHPPSLRVLTKVGMTVKERIEDADGCYLLCSTR